RVLAEAWNLDADQLGRADQQGSLGDADLEAVDGQLDHLLLGRHATGRRRLGDRHLALAPAVWWKRVDAAGSNGHPPCSKWARYSSRKYWIDEVIGAMPPSASAQNARPAMLSDRSSSFSRSASVPSPASRRWKICTSHQKPSRHGEHLPHDSCL